MKKHIARAAALGVVLIALVGCRSDKVMNVEKATLAPPSTASMEDIGQAVRRAGASLGWRMVEQGPGKIEATLILREHTAVAQIAFDRTSLSIHYVSSANLNYDAAAGTIHSNYNGWVTNLKNAIQAQVASM